MNINMYVINAILILMVVRQVREPPLETASLPFERSPRHHRVAIGAHHEIAPVGELLEGERERAARGVGPGQAVGRLLKEASA